MPEGFGGFGNANNGLDLGGVGFLAEVGKAARSRDSAWMKRKGIGGIRQGIEGVWMMMVIV